MEVKELCPCMLPFSLSVICHLLWLLMGNIHDTKLSPCRKIYPEYAFIHSNISRLLSYDVCNMCCDLAESVRIWGIDCEPEKGMNFYCFLLVWESFNCSQPWNHLTDSCRVFSKLYLSNEHYNQIEKTENVTCSNFPRLHHIWELQLKICQQDCVISCCKVDTHTSSSTD